MKGNNWMKNRLLELRESKEITQVHLAIEVGSTQQTISKIESGEYVPKLDLTYSLASYFNVSVDYLFCKTDIRDYKSVIISSNKGSQKVSDVLAIYNKLDAIDQRIMVGMCTLLAEAKEQREGKDSNVKDRGVRR